MSLLFFHGLESGPHGSKYRQLRAVYPELISPDFQGMDLQQRITKATEVTTTMSRAIDVGSSFGGLLAARMYSLYPERFRGLVLLAPAVHTEEGDKVERMPTANRVRVLQGSADDVVPWSAVQDFCKRFDLPLHTLNDGHRLGAETSQKAILEALESLLKNS